MFIHAPKVAREWIKKYGDVCKGKTSDADMKAKNDHVRKKG
jgi:hypothetical protein